MIKYYNTQQVGYLMMNNVRKRIYSFLLASTIANTIMCTNAEKISEEPNRYYFEENRGEKDFKSLDDIILNYEEEGKNVSNLAEKYTSNIFKIENENEFTNYFDINIENVEKQYIEYVKEKENYEHTYNSLYDSETNDIRWDKVAIKIWFNSIEKNYFNYKPLSYTDVNYVVYLFKDYLIKLKQDYPKIDIKEIACKLKTMNFYYDKDDLGVYAHATRKYIVFNDSDENIKKFDPNSNTSIHEFFHVMCFSCTCDNKKNYETNGLDLVLKNSDSENKDIYGIYYTFIEEASAERVMYHYTNNLPRVYNDYQKIIDNIEFVLSLNSNYNLDSYVESCLYNEPLKFIRRFPVGNENNKENFVDNVRMLVIYDTLLRYGYPNDKVLNNIMNRGNTPEEINESFFKLINYSQTQLTKLFFTNMIVLNEEQKNINNIEYYNYLINLFENRMYQACRLILMNWGLDEYSEKVINEYQESFEKMKNEYIKYFNYYYNDDYTELFDSNILNIPDISNITSLEKKDFYKKLESEIEIDVLCKPRKLTLKQ